MTSDPRTHTVLAEWLMRLRLSATVPPVIAEIPLTPWSVEVLFQIDIIFSTELIDVLFVNFYWLFPASSRSPGIDPENEANKKPGT